VGLDKSFGYWSARKGVGLDEDRVCGVVEFRQYGVCAAAARREVRSNWALRGGLGKEKQRERCREGVCGGGASFQSVLAL